MNAKIISLPARREYSIDKNEFSFGRNSINDIALNNDYVSRNHCKIFFKDNKYYIKDLNSQNGTFLNNILLKTVVELKKNDVIKLSENGPSFEFNIISELENKSENGTKKTMKIFKNFFSKNLLFIFTYIIIFLVIITIFLLMNKNMFFFIKDYTLINEINKIMKKYQEKEYHMLNYEVILKVKNYIKIYKDSQTYQIASENRKKYISMIDDTFKKNNIPFDLSYLAFVESNFNPNSYNAITGAKGLWQLMPSTARQYGLVVNRYTDERLDPKKSTEAAAKYLKDLLSIYGSNSILITIASYNAGEGVVIYSLKMIKDPDKDRTFWYLYNNNLIPPETKDYVLKVLAIKILSEDPDIKLN